MIERLKKIGEGVQEGWSGLEKKKRYLLVFILILVLTMVIALTYFTQKKDYAVLFSDLNDADAGMIVNDLDSQGIAYKLEDNGRTIKIDSQYVDHYRIELAVNDMLPQSSTGFEIFDETSMMATDEDRKIMYQRAVTGELERAISSLETVESVQVILSIPEGSVFTSAENQPAASASVVLTTQNDYTLDHSAIQGIATLVSGALDNLPEENVKIVDSSGNLLSAALSENSTVQSTDLTSKYKAIEAQYENELMQKLKEALGPVYGEENLTIAVNTTLSFDAVERESVEYGDASIRSENVNVSGGNVQIQEENGIDNSSNVTLDTEDEEGASSYDRTVNNELDTQTERTVVAPGDVVQLSASIVYNGTLTDVQASQIRSIAATAIGIEDPDIGISVEGILFASSEIEEEGPDETGENIIQFLLNNYWAVLVLGGVILMLILLLFRSYRRNNRDEYMDFYEDEDDRVEAPEVQLPAVNRPVEQPTKEINIEEYPEAESQKVSADEQELSEMEEVEEVVPDLAKELNKKMKEKENKVRTYAKENPEIAADLIKIWMKDE